MVVVRAGAVCPDLTGFVLAGAVAAGLAELAAEGFAVVVGFVAVWLLSCPLTTVLKIKTLIINRISPLHDSCLIEMV